MHVLAGIMSSAVCKWVSICINCARCARFCTMSSYFAFRANQHCSFLFTYIAWLHCFNGIYMRGTIESLFVTWTDCSEDLCQAVAESGVLIDIANSLHWALEHEELNSVCIFYNTETIYP